MKSFVVLILFLFSGTHLLAQVTVKKVMVLMGSMFDITVIAEDSIKAEYYIQSAVDEMSRIEYLISDWKPQSQISEVNKNAEIRPVKVDKEVFDLTQRAIQFSIASDGAFDISFASMDKIWKFDGEMEQLPDAATIQKAKEKIGYQNIILNSEESTIFLKLPGMKIGFGATGKGYAADRGREILQAQGVLSGIVNASGDMAIWSEKKRWKIGVASPKGGQRSLKVISIKNGAVTTSGDYNKYIEIDGKRYSHIINPKTGMPVTGLVSVTVFGDSAEVANGLSTSIMVLGKEKGLAMLEEYPKYSCMIVDDKGKVFYSENFKRVLKRLRK
ncbi:MAG: FAD:protein FMN transferase [Chitinophagales bacterium]|nr:FAD:protein FMN transferase [Chitinophagales bacterium]